MLDGDLVWFVVMAIVIILAFAGWIVFDNYLSRKGKH